ncbi:MAG: thiamine/thiamine pyrophosphate ABC transporter permease ThiP, partial [Beijerinckiaceae bacterium]
IMVAALAAIFVLALGALLRAGERADWVFLASDYVRRLLVSGFVQAALSTALSILCGALLALALMRLGEGAARRMALGLLAAMAAMPAIVLIFALVAVFGRSGWLAQIFVGGAGHDFSIYGLHGIIVAHGALNTPLAARMFLHALQNAPGEPMRLAAMLRFSPVDIFRHCDWPAMKPVLPGMVTLIFLLCFTSFAIVLALGGGPRNATLEVAIYEALRIEADFARAALLAFLQIAITSAIVFAAGWSIVPPPPAAGDGRVVARPDQRSRGVRLIDAAVLGAAALFFATLMLAALQSIGRLPQLIDADVIRAMRTSLLIGAPAALLSVGMALAIAFAARHAQFRLRRRGFALAHSAVPLAAIAAPPFALAAGFYLLLRPLIDPVWLGFFIVPLINGLTALPFVYRLLESPLMAVEARYGLIGAHLGVQGMNRFILIDWPAVKRPLIAAFVLAFALSLGDFGVAALFGGAEFRTLPLLLHERLGSYRIEEAGAVAALLMLAVLALGLAAEKLSADK